MSLRRRTDVPMIWDELADSDAAVAALVADDAAEGIGLKISKNGGLTRGRRHRDVCLAAGLTMSVQETTGSDVAFAAIVHLGQTVPRRFLRSLLECRDMVDLRTADGDFPVVDGHVTAPGAPGAPGLGVTARIGRSRATRGELRVSRGRRRDGRDARTPLMSRPARPRTSRRRGRPRPP